MPSRVAPYFFTFSVATFFALVSVVLVRAHTIEHVIIYMPENRAFDHLVGRYPGVDGVTDDLCNLINLDDPSQGKLCSTPDAPSVNSHDPNHDTWCTSQKIYGYHQAEARNFSNPTMDGFVDAERRLGTAKYQYSDVMRTFQRSTLPVFWSIVDEYGLMQKFYSSLAGPTWPNRLFHLTGTSRGLTETDCAWYRPKGSGTTRGVRGMLYPQRTIMDQVQDAGKDWKIYVNDTAWEMMIETIAHNPEKIQLTTQFFDDCKTGNLPSFSFLNPRAGIDVHKKNMGSSDAHPDHDMNIAEAAYKDIYEAVRSGPKWNNTLLIILWDEHGGFMDHVPPPQKNVPAPDDYESWPDKDYKFDRLGVRTPTVLISPWIPKNLLVDDPPASHKPTPDSKFDLTSAMVTVRKLLNISEGPLTKRDAWSADFSFLFDILDKPRTDCPMHLPDALPPSPAGLQQEAESPLNGLQKIFADVHGHLSDFGYPHHIKKQAEISPWLQKAFNVHKKETLRWKRSKESFGKSKKRLEEAQQQQQKQKSPVALKSLFDQHFHADHSEVAALTNETLYLRCQSMIQYSHITFLSNTFKVSLGEKYNAVHRTIASQINRTSPTGQKTSNWYCMTVDDKPQAGSEVGVSLCYPSRNPLINRDKAQHFVFESDRTVRPVLRPDLCVTSHCYDGVSSGKGSVPLSTSVTLEKCANSFAQHFAYQGETMGVVNQDIGTIDFGDAIMAFAITDEASIPHGPAPKK